VKVVPLKRFSEKFKYIYGLNIIVFCIHIFCSLGTRDQPLISHDDQTFAAIIIQVNMK